MVDKKNANRERHGHTPPGPDAPESEPGFEGTGAPQPGAFGSDRLDNPDASIPGDKGPMPKPRTGEQTGSD